MAPMTRSHALVPQADGPSRQLKFPEASWQFVPSETQSERALSEEPPSSYGEEVDEHFEVEEDAGSSLDIPLFQRPRKRTWAAANTDMADGFFDKRRFSRASAETPDDILHPLRNAANRVGREVELFAEALDSYNPLKIEASDERYEVTIELIDKYHEVAVDTVRRLRESHGSERRGQDGLAGKKKPRQINVDEMDLEESEAGRSLSPEEGTTVKDLERWEQEAQTWDLLRRLVLLRYPVPGADGTISRSTPKTTILHRFSTENEVWEDFLASDSLALERNTVLQWLKETADETGEDINVLVMDLQQNADRGDIIAHGWIHTKSVIKNEKRRDGLTQALDPASPTAKHGALSTGTEKLVTQLDPDAPTRQSRKLKAQDSYFERAIWLGCYEMLRRGKSRAEVAEWCAERTEIWRAISMSGFPDDKSADDEDTEPCNMESIILWRRMCFGLARKGGSDEYERAVYGILSGDIQTVEPVCRTWDDFVFTHYNSLLRTQFDNYLQQLRPQYRTNFTALDGVQLYGEPESAGRRLIATLKSDPRTSEQTKEPMKMLQGILIADQFSHFIYQQGLALSKFANANGLSNLIPANKKDPEDETSTKYVALDDHDGLRVLAHVLLIFMSLGVDLGGVFKETEVENVIVAYISFLRLAAKEELIPLYCSQLTGKRKYAILCRNLIDVTEPHLRVTQIKLMREMGLDVQEFVNLQARFLLSDYRDTSSGWPASGNFRLLVDEPQPGQPLRKIRNNFLGGDNDELDHVDILLIRSLEWYLLVDGLWSETFALGTMLYLRFFKHMHLQAARELAGKVTSEGIARKKTIAILGSSIDFNNWDYDQDEDTTEVVGGLKLDPDERSLVKKHLWAEARSFRELEALIIALDHIETVNGVAALMSENPNPVWQKDMKTSLVDAFPKAHTAMQPLLKSWLLTSQNEGVAHEFKLLREAYLPETLLAFVTIMRFAGLTLTRDFLLEAMEFSSVVAEEGSDLLDLFTKTGRMQDLVEIIAGASKDLLIVTSKKKGAAVGRSKKRRIGWTHELWSVKP